MRGDALLVRFGRICAAVLRLAAAGQFCALIALLVVAHEDRVRLDTGLALVCTAGVALMTPLALWLDGELRRARRRLRRARRHARPPRPTMRDAIAAVPHVVLDPPPPANDGAGRTR